MSTIPLDYETLRLVWWLLLGVLVDRKSVV